MIVTKQGDATSPRPDRRGVIIAHVANCIGAWGAGFVTALDHLSPVPAAAYRALSKQHNASIPLGHVQFVECMPGLFVSNMIAQIGIKKSDNLSCLVDYPALERCFKITFTRALQLDYDIHMPAGIGSGLAGGDKTKIHDLIKSCADEVETKSQTAKLLQSSSVIRELNITLWEFNDANAISFVDNAI